MQFSWFAILFFWIFIFIFKKYLLTNSKPIPGCCIGHNNHRYFMNLIFYVFIGTAYSTVLNTIFVWFVHGDIYRTSITIFKIIFPLAMLMFEFSSYQTYLLVYILNMIGAVFTGFLLFYHLRNIWRGCLTHESLQQFDLGPSENFRMVFGARWYISWISPYIRSDLPFDGINWQQIYEKSTKNL